MSQSNNNQNLVEELTVELANVSAGYIPAESFDKIIQLFENEISGRFFTRDSLSNLLRIIMGMYDKISFLNECLQYPHYVEIIISISVNSNYLTDILVRNPEYFYLIVNPSALKIKLSEEKFNESIKIVTGAYKSFNAKLNALRTLKRKEILRIGIKDILGEADLIEITEELSILARVITNELFSICYNKILEKYQLKDLNREYCIVALGKLGGNELNYSSDIDLIIFFDEDSHLNIKKEYSEILIEAIYLFIESISSITSSGFIYRVDFRLRPDGRNSPLARSIDEYLNYYESRGEDWERQMLIKASFAGGSKNLYERFINFLRPFIYPSSFSVSPTEQIKKMKVNIEKRLGKEENIKLIPGGIRDIEFSVQALQLLNGGKQKSVRTGNSLEAIEKLKSHNLFSEKEAQTFSEAYIFYRKIEHYLQLMNDSQTHTIPSDGEILEKLSFYLGFKNSAEFRSEVASRRKSVQKLYSSIMGIKSKTRNPALSYSEIHFENKNRALKDLDFLREGKGLLGQREFDTKSIKDFQAIENLLIEYLKKSFNPDLVLQNFVRVIRQANFPSIWYKEFRDKKYFNAFLKVCECGQKAIDLFAEDAELTEYFITKKIFEKLTSKSISKYSPKALLFVASVQFLLNLISEKQVSKIFKIYFTQKIQTIASEFNLSEDEYFIAAMGSFGSGEMTFASDIDLIFVVKDLEIRTEIQKEFQNLLLQIKEKLKPLEVDCRLRPEGKSSILVWELQSYETYLETRARVWEFQAFCKLNFIYGNKKLCNKLIKAIHKNIFSLDETAIKAEMFEMRKKLYPQFISIGTNKFNIKKSRGGLADIDFIVQYLILTNPDIYNNVAGQGILKSIAELKKSIKDETDFEKLEENFLFLKRLEISNQIIFNSTQPAVPTVEAKLTMLRKLLRFETNEDFKNKLSQVTKFNNSLFEKFFR